MAEKKQVEIIDTKQRVTVYATAKNKHVKTGKEMLVHPKIAEKLIKNGMATDKKATKSAN